MSRNINAKKKLTNKEIEHHLNHLYNAVTQESNTLTTTMQVLTDYIEFCKNTEGFQEFVQTKYKKDEKSDKKLKINKK